MHIKKAAGFHCAAYINFKLDNYNRSWTAYIEKFNFSTLFHAIINKFILLIIIIHKNKGIA